MPKRRTQLMKKHRIIQHSVFLFLFGILLCIISCATNPVTGQQEFMLLSKSDEIRLGRKTDAQIARNYGLYDDPDLTAYIDRIGQRIAKGSHRPDLSFQFRVLDSPVVNAFAAPGGFVYVTRGILSYFTSEAELSGVLGHEIGHVAARHSAQQYTKAQVAQLGLGLGTILSKDFREFAGLAQFGVGMLFLKFSRDNERQADDLGVEYATRAGFDAGHMADFFATLQRLQPSSDGSGLPGWFSTHPDPPDRIRAVQALTKDWTQKLGSKNLQVNQDSYMRQIDGLVFGEDPRQGYLDDNVFYHPTLRFEFPVPTEWKLNNSPAAVQIVNKKKDAAIVFSIESESSPNAAARKFIAQAEARVIRSEVITVNRLPAQRLISDINTQQGPIRVMSYFILKGKPTFVFHGFSSQAIFERYESIFRATMGGFRALTDPKRIDVEPERIRILATRSSSTLKEALYSAGVADQKLKDMALLNGRHLHDMLPANTLFKVVEP
jgi:predicted Zn-dependent protease